MYYGGLHQVLIATVLLAKKQKTKQSCNVPLTACGRHGELKRIQ